MAHRLENRIVKLNGSRNQEGGVIGLGRHLRRGSGAEWSCLGCWGINTQRPFKGVRSIERNRRFEIQVSGNQGQSLVRSHDGDRGVQSAK